MKSLKIAALGVAALGFAALPVAGAFAAADKSPITSHIDKITINVESSCTLGTITNGQYNNVDATTHGDGTNTDKTNDTGFQGSGKNGVWSEGTVAAVAPAGRTDTLTASMLPGTSTENLGTTTLTILCNDKGGYDLKAVGGALTSEAVAAIIPTKAVAAGESYWNFKLTTEDDVEIVNAYSTATGAPSSETTVAYKTSVGNVGEGEKVTVTYGAGIADNQPAATYSGSITYTLVNPHA